KNVTTHKLQIQSLTGGTEYCNYIMTNNWSPSANTWYHIAFVRSSTSIYIFIGGTSQSLTATTAVSTNSFVNVAGIMKVGTQDETNNVNGWIDEFRVSKGIARWTANFTPPTRAYGKGMSGAYLFF
ncbi:MAG TPA: LamG-like jellyroll fold domain-containing protein, partial [Methanosarcinales archaeon]|nr:LamG-like jellyroll fold domain-containing protein [Methanosarcinales archaeon]